MSEPLPEYGPCLWVVDPTCLTDSWAELSPDQQERGIALASSTLHRLTGGRVGGCPITVRPCHRIGVCGAYMPYSASGASWFPGVNASGQWFNSGRCNDGCAHTVCEVVLPSPVGRVDQVKVDGSVLNPADYRVDNGNLLTWQGTGACPWPQSQDFNLPDTEVGTFSVTYLNSYPVDRLGAQAAGILALEFGLACNGSKNCRLPINVVNVVRQGVSYELRPGIFPDGYTGIDQVDVYISSWNPKGMSQDSSVWSPGGSTTYRVIGS